MYRSGHLLEHSEQGTLDVDVGQRREPRHRIGRDLISRTAKGSGIASFSFYLSGIGSWQVQGFAAIFEQWLVLSIAIRPWRIRWNASFGIMDSGERYWGLGYASCTRT